jgi:hypothetical protein
MSHPWQETENHKRCYARLQLVVIYNRLPHLGKQPRHKHCNNGNKGVDKLAPIGLQEEKVEKHKKGKNRDFKVQDGICRVGYE